MCKKVYTVEKSTQILNQPVLLIKGVQGSECMTRHRLVSPAFGRPKKNWNPLYFGLKTAQNIDLRTLDYVNNLVVALNVIPADYWAIKAI